MLFSKPSSRWFEKGRLLGSAQTRKTLSGRSPARPEPKAATTISAVTIARSELRTHREYIESSASRSLVRQVLHRVDKTERSTAVVRVEPTRNDGARPTADS